MTRYTVRGYDHLGHEKVETIEAVKLPRKKLLWRIWCAFGHVVFKGRLHNLGWRLGVWQWPMVVVISVLPAEPRDV